LADAGCKVGDLRAGEEALHAAAAEIAASVPNGVTATLLRWSGDVTQPVNRPGSSPPR